MAEPNQPTDNFFNQFLDDYFTECEEHLTVVRRVLLSIEQFVDRSQINPSELDELFRAFHTIKGISGMVGLAPAEQLAHEMEGYLGALRQNEAVLSRLGFEALIEGTKNLKEVIAAHRAGQQIPDINQPIVLISNALAATEKASLTEARSLGSAGDADKRTWRIHFVPTHERAQAGINVNSVRSRLQSLGEIIRATPIVDKGEVLFEFILLTDAAQSDLNDLDELGLDVLAEEGEPTAKNERPVAASSISTISGGPTTVRVDLKRLDELMLLVGELVVTRARLEQNLNTIRTTVPPSNWRQLQEINVALGKQLRDLRNDVMRVRMVPIAEVFERMRFVVRDLARETQKRVVLQMSGQDTEIDKFLVERLADPLLHLVRNAISHGIESEAERFASGKSPDGHIFLSAKTAGELVVIEVRDDGRGVDLKSIEAQVPGLKLTSDEGEVDFDQLLVVISSPGFSTRDEADRASGRGVGMDVVARAVDDLDARLSLYTEPGVGTTFSLELPLTLAITDALIAVADGHTFAIHRSSVQEVIEIDPSSIKVLENNEIVLHREEPLPLVRVSSVFNLKEKTDGPLHAFVIGTGSRATGLVFDKIVGLREVVVRPLKDPLTGVPGVAGATELGDGRPILILDVLEILNASRRSSISQTI